MFTGIIEEVGKLSSAQDGGDGRKLVIAASVVTQGLKLGDSIAVNGTCLTAIDFSSGFFVVEASFETLRKTSLGGLGSGAPVNLERAMKLGDRLGGHLVSGHVDGLGVVSQISKEGFSRIIEFSVEGRFAPYFIEKGSVAVDGVSLTVYELKEELISGSVSKLKFSVALIPHTLSATTLQHLKVGSVVNIECDLIGKYVSRWVNPQLGSSSGASSRAPLSLETLVENGFGS